MVLSGNKMWVRRGSFGRVPKPHTTGLGVSFSFFFFKASLTFRYKEIEEAVGKSIGVRLSGRGEMKTATTR